MIIIIIIIKNISLTFRKPQGFFLNYENFALGKHIYVWHVIR